MPNWTNRGLVLTMASLLGVAGSTMLLGQKSPTAGGGSGSAGAGAGAAPTSTRGTPTTTTNTPTLGPNNNNNTNPNNDPFSSRPIFLSGKVMFDDGSPMNQDIRIERVCGTTTRTEAHADGKGRFSFQLGNNAAEISSADASQSGFGMGTQQNSNSPFGGSGSSSSSRGTSSEAALWGCELRASYPGYRSDVIALAGRRTMDDPNVGTIILHRLGNVQGTTISMTTAEAPKSAQKNFEKGMQAARKGSAEEAEKHFVAATSEYPKYALAWFALGQVQQGQNKNEEARKSYLAAIAADKRYVSPYDQLALLAARDTKWEDAASYSKQAIDLNPVEFPSSFWYNTVANYNMNKDAEAAKSGQALLKLDTQHRFPEVNRLLAEVALNGKDYAAAADYLKAYLAQVPTAKDAETLKQQLLKIEEASVQVKK
jgi:Tfp pilus assembly protein PilF